MAAREVKGPNAPRSWLRFGRRRVVLVQPDRSIWYGVRLEGLTTLREDDTHMTQDTTRLSLRVALPVLLIMGALGWWGLIELALRILQVVISR